MVMDNLSMTWKGVAYYGERKVAIRGKRLGHSSSIE